MYEPSEIRVLLACGLTFIGLVLSLILLTAGSRHDYLQEAAFSIVPVPDPHPHYWDGLDWVALHFLSVNAGTYDPITHARINITISHDLAWREIFVVEKTNHRLPLAFHSAGLGTTGLAFILLPFFYTRKIRHHGWVALLLLLAWVFSAISGVAIILDARMPNNDQTIKQPNVAIPMQWTAVACIFLACLLQTYEYVVRKWMLAEQRKSEQGRPDSHPRFRFNPRWFSAVDVSARPKRRDRVAVRNVDIELEHGNVRKPEDETPSTERISIFVPSPARSSRSALRSPMELLNAHRKKQQKTDDDNLRSSQPQHVLPSIVLDPPG